ncbi:NAD(P)/FAD-dependent oxidoreductase [Pelagibius sp.]|uniref:NAD(P)/FAD-dependent oxidoreductase n=1 Tax=Pelagibius sp. TaxID=1931238 RepID=UPI003B503B5A
MKASQADIVVIGGGLIGLSSALAAARAGLSVTLLEAAVCGRFASSASAGGVRSLNRHPAEIPLARAALDLWRRLPELVGDDGGFSAAGQIRIAEDADSLAALERRHAMVKALGYDHERLIGPQELKRRLPDLAADCKGALVVDDDGFADPLRCIHAFRRAAADAGVMLRENCPVTAIERGGDRLHVVTAEGVVAAGQVVNAAGAWGGKLAAAVGEPVPLRPAALQMLVTERLPPFAEAVIGSEGHKLSLKQSSEGTVIIGGGYEGMVDPDSGTTGLCQSKVRASLATAVRLFPGLRGAALVRSWAGIEGMVEDGLPVLGASATTPGLVHAFGFSAHGFALAPLVGRLVRDLCLGQSNNVALSPFAVGRFAETAEQPGIN